MKKTILNPNVIAGMSELTSSNGELITDKLVASSGKIPIGYLFWLQERQQTPRANKTIDFFIVDQLSL
ncbi:MULTISPECIES: hypothetical protein [unclassified Algoriphagus]|jgi:hypothetical protein|uniref:hypothetical protein n=1 Tax=unclassified Algoriphagus TaxID=2641541 RepID=UPI000C981BC6|nr:MULTISPECIES: hypothetical protein [unclassified Algoriphagus]MAN87197.1 hypothetical protein [Algoriphagus sp.]QYH40937.1 hypothetical protein GYM62_19815 [Algoriphagus sp. NBT04N3]HAH37495.1 hypothetical protein [Algoriphagus sp.]|tara:strand:- start:349 stop:552 length:204 start_codon:yes stop_codon:yes gene_type:complete